MDLDLLLNGVEKLLFLQVEVLVFKIMFFLNGWEVFGWVFVLRVIFFMIGEDICC